MDISEIIEENRRRNEQERLLEQYDPLHGINCAYASERVRVANSFTDGVEYVPPEMLRDPEWPKVYSPQAWQALRIRYDFEYWCALCARIKHKTRPEIVPFILNRGQRRVVGILEGQRRAGEPMRLIVLKARQWGCSTVVEMYMAWIQCCLMTNWHSLLCAQVGAAAGAIRDMVTRLLDNYPLELWQGDGKGKPELVPFQGQPGIRSIRGRDCHIALATSESVNTARGSDFAMAHLTEVAFWKDSPMSRPADLVRAVCSSVAHVPMTLVVMESTANGVGNFFHREWCRCQSGRGDKLSLFVPWYEIGLYREEVKDPAALWRSLDAYERSLWTDFGLTLERIAWYHAKRLETQDHAAMMAEYPTTPDEAFVSTSRTVFSSATIDRMRPACSEITPEKGCLLSSTGRATGVRSLMGLAFHTDLAGEMKVWRRPSPGERYVVTVDVGGRWAKADWSVIAVFRLAGGVTEVVAQWRGHIDHDLLTWKAAQVATWYCQALLVFESNTLEHEAGDNPATPQGAYMLHVLSDSYPNLYYRESPGEEGGRLPGFHTNRATKQMIITELIAAVRDGRYIERDPGALDELAVYVQLPSGAYGASPGHHDDRVMTRAIALHVAQLPAFNPDIACDYSPDAPSDPSLIAARDPSLARFLTPFL